MEGIYGIYLGKKLAGKAQVKRQGLYYVFRCRCQLPEEDVFRLSVSCGEKKENLGVVIPLEGGFGLDTRLPVKRLGEGSLEFQLHSRHAMSEGTFVPICPEEPFRYISRLKESFLVRKNGQAGIEIRR